jgi:hypothetical protein
MALGEQIIPDERGKVVGVRVLPADGPGMNPIEITFQTQGTILGVGFANTGTVVSVPTEAGTLWGQGQGMAMTQDGEPISWTFQGLATVTGPNMAGRFRGSVIFQTPSSKLARLNSLCAVVEAEVDGQQQMTAKLWEWA